MRSTALAGPDDGDFVLFAELVGVPLCLGYDLVIDRNGNAFLFVQGQLGKQGLQSEMKVQVLGLVIDKYGHRQE